MGGCCYSARIFCQTCKACNQSILLLTKHLVTPFYICSYKKNKVYSRLVFEEVFSLGKVYRIYSLLLHKLDLMIAWVFSLVSSTSARAMEKGVSVLSVFG